MTPHRPGPPPEHSRSGPPAHSSPDSSPRLPRPPRSTVDVPPTRSVSGELAAPSASRTTPPGTSTWRPRATTPIVVHRKNASGASAPLRRISGAATQLATPRDVALDSNGFLYVVNLPGTRPRVRRRTPTANVAPVKTFGTGPGQAFGIDIGGGEIYVRKTNALQRLRAVGHRQPRTDGAVGHRPRIRPLDRGLRPSGVDRERHAAAGVLPQRGRRRRHADPVDRQRPPQHRDQRPGRRCGRSHPRGDLQPRHGARVRTERRRQRHAR